MRKSARAPFPLITAEKDEEAKSRRATVLRGLGLDTSDPSAGGGRSFYYEWEYRAQVLEQLIDGVVAGGGGASYVHHQPTPSATWVIDHHMGLIPNVVLVDGGGQEMIAEIRHPSDQQCVVVHSAPYSGTAYLRP